MTTHRNLQHHLTRVTNRIYGYGFTKKDFLTYCNDGSYFYLIGIEHPDLYQQVILYEASCEIDEFEFSNDGPPVIISIDEALNLINNRGGLKVKYYDDNE